MFSFKYCWIRRTTLKKSQDYLETATKPQNEEMSYSADSISIEVMLTKSLLPAVQQATYYYYVGRDKSTEKAAGSELCSRIFVHDKKKQGKQLLLSQSNSFSFPTIKIIFFHGCCTDQNHLSTHHEFGLSNNFRNNHINKNGLFCCKLDTSFIFHHWDKEVNGGFVSKQQTNCFSHRPLTGR